MALLARHNSSWVPLKITQDDQQQFVVNHKAGVPGVQGFVRHCRPGLCPLRHARGIELQTARVRVQQCAPLVGIDQKPLWARLPEEKPAASRSAGGISFYSPMAKYKPMLANSGPTTVPGTRTTRIALLLRPVLCILQEFEGSARGRSGRRIFDKGREVPVASLPRSPTTEPRRRGTSQYLSCRPAS